MAAHRREADGPRTRVASARRMPGIDSGRGGGLRVAATVFFMIVAGGAAGLILVHQKIEATALARLDAAAAAAERSVLGELTRVSERLDGLAGDPRLAQAIAERSDGPEGGPAAKVHPSPRRAGRQRGAAAHRPWLDEAMLRLGAADLRLVDGGNVRVLFSLGAGRKDPTNRGVLANTGASLGAALAAAAPGARFPLVRQGRAGAGAPPFFHVLTPLPAAAEMGPARSLLVATFPADRLTRSLLAPVVASQLLLVAPDGTALGAPASAAPRGRTLDSETSGELARAGPRLTRAATSNAELLADASPGLRQALAGEPHLGALGTLRDGLLGAWRPLEAGGQRWVLAAELPRAALLRELTPAAASILVAALLGGILGGWIGRRQWQRFAARLRTTLDAATRAQRSAEPAALPEPSGPAGEIARLVNQLLAERVQAQARAGQERARIAAEAEALASALSPALAAGDAPVFPPTSGLLAPVSAAAAAILATNAELRTRLRDTASRFETTTGRLHALVERTRTGARDQGRECGQGGRSAGEVRQAHQALEAGCAQTLELGRRAEHASRLGREAIDDLLTGMEGLQRDTRAATIKIKRLGERSMQVAAIVGSISKLSAQTDMLALNAAIEASRAGEQGQGFTLVAEEVRKLAERASAAAREVERLIEGVRSDVGDAVGGLERQSERLDLHAAAAGAASEALDRAFAAIGDTSEALRHVAASADGEADAVENLQQSFARLAETATLLSHSGEESARAMRDLREVARALDLPETRPAA